MFPERFVSTLGVLFCTAIAPVAAQTLQLSDALSDSTHVEAVIGDIVEVEVRANLGGMSASGASLYVLLPSEFFAVVDQSDSDEIQPFVAGDLFAGAVEMENGLLESEASLPAGRHMLAYSLVLGPGSERRRSGVGAIARFQVKCLQETGRAQIELFSNPVYDAFLVEEDGVSERHFRGLQGLDVVMRAPKAASLRLAWAQIKQKYAD